MIGNEERRDFLRMAVDKEVQLVDSSSGDKFNGTCHDLSATGMSLFVEQAIAKDTAVDVTIEGHFNMVEPLKAQGRVVRCDDRPEGGYVVGLEILSLH